MGTVQLNMVGLMVKDMAASLAFYRRLGLEIPDEADTQPFVRIQMPSGVSIFWDTVFAGQHDPGRKSPKDGYQIMLEFFLETEEAVERVYAELVGAGYTGRSGPMKTVGPYAALIDDPDGNVILLTADSIANSQQPAIQSAPSTEMPS